MDLQVATLILGGIIFIFILRFLKKLKFVFKLLINTIIGGIALLIINGFGGVMGVCVGINWVTCLVVGLLGFPGLIALYLLRIFVYN